MHLQNWIMESKNSTNEDVVYILIGNKADREEKSLFFSIVYENLFF